MKQWIRGEGEAIPGKTMPSFKIVKRDYKNVYKQFISWGPLVRQNGLGAHGTQLRH
jgi:nitrate reductase alpha subunit